MKIAIVAESDPSEPRVAATAETVRKMIGLGAEVAVEPGAGIKSGILDAEYSAAGASVGNGAASGADVVLTVRRPSPAELNGVKPGALVISIMDPYGNEAAIKALADVTPLASRARFDLRGIQQELLDSVRWDGVLYSLPYGGVANLVVYNAGQFQKRGVPLPPDQVRANTWTWEGFRDTLRRLTLRAPGQPPEVGMPEHFRGR